MPKPNHAKVIDVPNMASAADIVKALTDMKAEEGVHLFDDAISINSNIPHQVVRAAFSKWLGLPVPPTSLHWHSDYGHRNVYWVDIQHEVVLADFPTDLFTEDLETHENESGGKQSALDTRFDLVPPKALAEVAAVLHQGAAKYGEENWRLIDRRSHINHALRHLYRFILTGDREDLSHAACRILFALETS